MNEDIFLIHKHRDSILLDSTSPQLICRFNLIPIKILAGFLVEIGKLILMEMQRT